MQLHNVNDKRSFIFRIDSIDNAGHRRCKFDDYTTRKNKLKLLRVIRAFTKKSSQPELSPQVNCLPRSIYLFQKMSFPRPTQPNSSSSCQGVIFLPHSTVNLAFKLAKIFEISSYNLFSLLDSLLEVILKSANLATENVSDKTVCIMLINIIRISEKLNNAASQLTKVKLDAIFVDLGISSEEFDKHEFEVYSLMGFKASTPLIVETIHNLIEVHLPNVKRKDYLFEFSMDILKMVYALRNEMYAE